MAATDPHAGATAPTDLALFAYDGSELAELAIAQAGSQLASGRDALVVCIWQPSDVGFVPTGGRHLDAADACAVREAAEATAAHGASLAESAGFQTQSRAIQAAPTWKGLVTAAEEHDASLIVLGSHRRSGLTGRVLGSVAAAVVTHSERSVLVVHRRS
jgi:nucleotide-binding universal stress UspA family protein